MTTIFDFKKSQWVKNIYIGIIYFTINLHSNEVDIFFVDKKKCWF